MATLPLTPIPQSSAVPVVNSKRAGVQRVSRKKFGLQTGPAYAHPVPDARRSKALTNGSHILVHERSSIPRRYHSDGAVRRTWPWLAFRGTARAVTDCIPHRLGTRKNTARAYLPHYSWLTRQTFAGHFFRSSVPRSRERAGAAIRRGSQILQHRDPHGASVPCGGSGSSDVNA